MCDSPEVYDSPYLIGRKACPITTTIPIHLLYCSSLIALLLTSDYVSGYSTTDAYDNFCKKVGVLVAAIVL
jgi:hypothetical protein